MSRVQPSRPRSGHSANGRSAAFVASSSTMDTTTASLSRRLAPYTEGTVASRGSPLRPSTAPRRPGSARPAPPEQSHSAVLGATYGQQGASKLLHSPRQPPASTLPQFEVGSSNHLSTSVSATEWLALLLERSLEFAALGDFAAALRCLAASPLSIKSSTHSNDEHYYKPIASAPSDGLHALLCSRFWLNLGVYQACCGQLADGLASFQQVQHLQQQQQQQQQQGHRKSAEEDAQWDSMLQCATANIKQCHRLEQERALFAVHHTPERCHELPKLLRLSSSELAQLFYWFRSNAKQPAASHHPPPVGQLPPPPASFVPSAQKVVEEVNLVQHRSNHNSGVDHSLVKSSSGPSIPPSSLVEDALKILCCLNPPTEFVERLIVAVASSSPPPQVALGGRPRSTLGQRVDGAHNAAQILQLISLLVQHRRQQEDKILSSTCLRMCQELLAHVERLLVQCLGGRSQENTPARSTDAIIDRLPQLANIVHQLIHSSCHTNRTTRILLECDDPSAQVSSLWRVMRQDLAREDWKELTATAEGNEMMRYLAQLWTGHYSADVGLHCTFADCHAAAEQLTSRSTTSSSSSLSLLRNANEAKLLQAVGHYQQQHGSGAIRLIVSRPKIVQELGSYFHCTAPLLRPSSRFPSVGLLRLSPEEVVLRRYEFVIKGEPAIDGGTGGVTNEVYTVYCDRMIDAAMFLPRHHARHDALLQDFGSSWAVVLRQSAPSATTTGMPLLMSFLYATTVQRWAAFGVLIGKMFSERRVFGALQRAPLMWQQMFLSTTTVPDTVGGMLLLGGDHPTRSLKVLRHPFMHCFISHSLVQWKGGQSVDRMMYVVGGSLPELAQESGPRSELRRLSNMLLCDAAAAGSSPLKTDPLDQDSSSVGEAEGAKEGDAFITFTEIAQGALAFIESFVNSLAWYCNQRVLTQSNVTSARGGDAEVDSWCTFLHFQGFLAEMWRAAEGLDREWVQQVRRSEGLLDVALCPPLMQSLLEEGLQFLVDKESRHVRHFFIQKMLLFDFVFGRRLLILFAAGAGLDSVRSTLFRCEELRLRTVIPNHDDDDDEREQWSVGAQDTGRSFGRLGKCAMKRVAAASTLSTLWSTLGGPATLNAQSIIQMLDFVGWGREERSPLLLCHWLRLCSSEQLRGFLRWTTGTDTLPLLLGDDDDSHSEIIEKGKIRVLKAEEGKGPYGQTCFRTLLLPVWGEGVTAHEAEQLLTVAMVALLETEDGCKMFEMS